MNAVLYVGLMRYFMVLDTYITTENHQKTLCGYHHVKERLSWTQMPGHTPGLRTVGAL